MLSGQIYLHGFDYQLRPCIVIHSQPLEESKGLSARNGVTITPLHFQLFLTYVLEYLGPKLRERKSKL